MESKEKAELQWLLLARELHVLQQTTSICRHKWDTKIKVVF